MSEIIFGTPEHVAGLSRKALEEDFRWVNDRRMELEGECERLDAENAKLREELSKWERLTAGIDLPEYPVTQFKPKDLERENAKLREQMERLVTLLRVDCDIDASWDGLRRFWSIELTEGGCLMRDRACKAEAEADRLRERVDAAHMSRLLTENENESLRELVRDLYEMAYPECPSAFETTFADRMRELGMEVE